MSENPTPVILLKTGSNGYSADQVAAGALTVGDLIAELQEAVERGDITEGHKVVVQGYGRGAVYEPLRAVDTEEVTDDGYGSY